jgi:hypothetical protein
MRMCAGPVGAQWCVFHAVAAEALVASRAPIVPAHCTRHFVAQPTPISQLHRRTTGTLWPQRVLMKCHLQHRTAAASLSFLSFVLFVCDVTPMKDEVLLDNT